MRRIVLDTNVLLDCWVFDDPSATPLARAIESGSARPLRSVATDAELGAVLERPVFGLNEAARHALLASWSTRAEMVDVDDAAPLHCADPADQKFLDLALAGRADALFTKDKALLATAARARQLGLRIVRPQDLPSVFFFEDDVA